MRPRLALAIPLLIAFTGAASAQSLDVSKLFQSNKADKLSNGDIVSGLKEALHVGAGNTVDLTGRVDGYFGNAAIKILLPEQMRSVETGLRALGQGERVDEFVLAMNRAAEQAAPAAKDIFWGAITDMSFDDARRILSGGDTAATDYFRTKTTDRLTASFRPVVHDTMSKVGVVQQYDKLQSAYKSVPFASTLPSFDVETYVVGKALDGLFVVLAEQEKKIRTDPAAQVTDILKKVFGK
jgi:hypothetical protein